MASLYSNKPDFCSFSKMNDKFSNDTDRDTQWHFSRKHPQISVQFESFLSINLIDLINCRYGNTSTKPIAMHITNKIKVVIIMEEPARSNLWRGIRAKLLGSIYLACSVMFCTGRRFALLTTLIWSKIHLVECCWRRPQWIRWMTGRSTLVRMHSGGNYGRESASVISSVFRKISLTYKGISFLQNEILLRPDNFALQVSESYVWIFLIFCHSIAHTLS